MREPVSNLTTVAVYVTSDTFSCIPRLLSYLFKLLNPLALSTDSTFPWF